MKAIAVIASVLGVLLVVAAPAVGRNAEPATPATPNLFLSRMDQVMISAQDFSEWMGRHKTRFELRDTNEAIESMCDRLQDAERRMSTIASDPGLKPEGAESKEIRRFGEEIATVAQQLATLHASMRRMAEAAPAADSASGPDRERLAVHQQELITAIDEAGRHSRESHTWVIQKPAPRGLDEMSRDVDLARTEVRGIVMSLGRLASDPVLPADRVRELDQVQDCARALLQALGEAQDRIATLAQAF